ncbi:phage portal protein [Catenuloplanes sp. NPDC051500]|uniref:phage portal protein n=1 Tax=Catenuloplanes sp. NPDC051500 TaxID=3363959 RepID=UPI0037A53B3B
MADSELGYARQLLATLHKDRDRLQRIDDYVQGEHDDPYMPISSDAEYRLLAERSVSNWMPLLLNTPAQAMYVDSVRRADKQLAVGEQLSEWRHWQRSGLDARQLAIHKGALKFGHSFTLTEAVRKGRKRLVKTKGLSAMRTAALFEDAANDQTPIVAITVTAWPRDDKPGKARMFDETYEYEVTFGSLGDADSVKVLTKTKHGASECPVTRFAAAVDLEGRTVGVIEPMIALQNRINQTVFDLLLAQSYQSSQVRYATGMAPPVKRDPETGEVELDSAGNPIPLPINHNARRFLFAEDPDVKFGSLEATPLEGLIASIDMSIRHLAAISQTPPHHLLGQIANLSAEALEAAETALLRKVQEFRNSFGEAWERVFRLAAELEGDADGVDAYSCEVLWRDMEMKSLAQSADGLGKLSAQLGIPARGLWPRVPGVTRNEVDEWERIAEESDSQLRLAQSITRATTRQHTTPAQTTTAAPIAA